MKTEQGKISSPEIRILEAGSKNIENDIFPGQETRADESIVSKYVEATKIDSATIKSIGGFLAKDADKAMEDFALEWFKNNEEKIKEKGIIIPPDVSDEWKISMVLGSKESGGMGAVGEIRGEKYEEIRDKIKRIEELRTDMKSDNVPPEAPFLLLHYLQEKIKSGQKELEALEVEAKKGDIVNDFMIINKKNELRELSRVYEELEVKMIDKDSRRMAEEAVDVKITPKEEYVKGELTKKEKGIAGLRYERLAQLVQKD